MKKNLTELVFILDRSGSMAGLETDTIGGFNAMIRKQKELEGEVLVSTVLFDHARLVLHDRADIQSIQDMTLQDYQVRGSTALIDAIGCSIHHIANIHKYARKEDIPEKTVFVITTDGMENSSSLYSSAEVKAMIQKEQEKYNWEFLFLGANIDAVETAAGFGIRRENAVDYHADCQGTAVVYEGISEAVCSFRAEPCAAPARRHWRDKIDEDYRSRGKM